MDGINWIRVQDGPVFAASQYSNWRLVWVYNVVILDDVFYLLTEVMSSSTSIFKVSTFEGVLFGEEEVSYKDLPEEIEGKAGTPMMHIPAGPFLMGSDELNNSFPHMAYLSPYYIDIYEVRNEQFVEFMNEAAADEPVQFRRADVAQRKLAKLPKAVLHLHLEGAMLPSVF